MRRERLIARRHAHGEEAWWAAAPTARQFLHRDTSAREDVWAVKDPLGLLHLIYADGRGGLDGFLPWLQAVGRLEPEDLARLLAALHADGLVRSQPTRSVGASGSRSAARGSSWRASGRRALRRAGCRSIDPRARHCPTGICRHARRRR